MARKKMQQVLYDQKDKTPERVSKALHVTEKLQYLGRGLLKLDTRVSNR